MLTRIVKMVFQPAETENFLALFNQKKHYIRNFDGCEYLELYRDQNNPTTFFTYSYWVDEHALENYRHSALFRETWKNTKPKFSEPAQAWSVDKLVSLP